MDTFRKFLRFFALILLVLAIPFAVAGQHIVSGISAAAMFALIWMNSKDVRLRVLPTLQSMSLYMALLFLFLSTLFISNLIHPYGPKSPIHFWGGYLLLLFLPPIAKLALPKLSPAEEKSIDVALSIVVILHGLVAASQFLWPWKLDAGEIVADLGRSRGLYSHPLTFAYVNLVLFPWALQLLMKEPRKILNGLTFLGALSSVYFSQSKTVQAVLIIYICAVLFLRMQKQSRLKLSLVCMLLLAVLFGTNNPLSRKYQNLWRDQSGDRNTHYADDRLAFWDVHWLMFQERPLIGHGTEMDSDYRAPYYEAKGLGALEKKYEAHNMLLQILVEGGLIGFLFFAAWYAWVMAFSFNSAKQNILPRYFFETFLIFIIAGITQNAFQDAEVRYTLSVMIFIMFLLIRDRQLRLIR